MQQHSVGFSLSEFVKGDKKTKLLHFVSTLSNRCPTRKLISKIAMEPPLRSSPKPGLKVVRSREHIPMQERRGSEVSFNNQQVALVSCASAQSLQG